MKKWYISGLILALFLMALPICGKAQTSPTASKDIFDWTPFEDVKMVQLFYNAIKEGRSYPSDQQFRDAFGFDIEFARSHVRPRSVMYDPTKQVDPTINPKRKLWMNIPGGIGPGNGGYQSSLFNNDVFSMWQYTHLFGSWNHGVFQAPGAWGDAAHKHGTDIFSGIKFFESWTSGSGDANYTSLIATKENGRYKYAEAFINCLMYLGLDGINYNWEDNSYSNTDVIEFHKELYRIADEKGFDNFHIGLYTSVSGLTSGNKNSLYYGHNPQKKTMDLMLNYNASDFAFASAATSIATAKGVNVSDDISVYQGVWIVSMDRSWTAMNTSTRKEMNLCLWGEHGQSRFLSYNSGADAFDIQENYQKLLERGFSGGNRNPANRPVLSNTGNNWEKSGTKEALSTFGGLATMIAERPTVQGKLPFYTNFQLGNGERYNFKGKKTFGNWYNMGAQDYQPTYRWLVYDANTTTVSSSIQPSYTHRDAYTGGSSLQLKGTASTNGTDIVLYRTDLEVSASNPKVSVAVKSYKKGENPTNLFVILKKKDNATWYELPVGNTTGQTWQEFSLPMAGFAFGDHIEYVGLRVKAASATPDYSLFVGKLALSDDREVGDVAPIQNLIVEVKRETQKSMAVKLNWKINSLEESARATQTGLVYNDEGNVDHFEVMYKNGENGRISEVARTSTWANYVGDIEFKDSPVMDEPYIGVRSASIDGKNYSPIVWVKIPRANVGQLPVYMKDVYCTSEINPDAEGASIASLQRYLTEVRTTGLDQNLNYTASAPVADGSQYKNATDISFTAAQGQTFNFFFKAADFSDGIKWCFAKAYIDWDKDGNFDPATEMVFDLGSVRAGTPAFQTTGVTQSFTVPNDANPGQSRMRIVFSDAWFTHPGPCGLTAKGFSIDFTVNITGSNPPYISEDKHDQGIADEPDNVREEIGTGVGVQPSSPSSVSHFFPNPVDDYVCFENVEEVWIYSIDGKLVFTQKDCLGSVSMGGLKPGVYVVKMLNNSVVRTSKLKKN
ncbi:MAG: hypothetical protein KBH01_02390 [Breznakibacter sp.]|nr:hypothetical protein [Breznakibacter sp.]